MAGFTYPEHNLKLFTDFKWVSEIPAIKQNKTNLPIFHKQASR